MTLIGERTGKTFKISDKVKVKVVACDKKERTIDFEVVGMPAYFLIMVSFYLMHVQR